MRYWTKEAIVDDEDAPEDITYIAENVLNLAIDYPRTSRPRLIYVGKHDSADDFCMFEVLLELAPGVILPTECGLVEAYLEGHEDCDEDEAIALVEEGLAICMPQLDRLADMLHDARVRARRMIAAWQTDGLATTLVEVRLAPYDHWRGSQDPKLLVQLEALDERLASTVAVVHVDHVDALEQELLKERVLLDRRSSLRIALMRRGASGTIDQRALNAIAAFGDQAQSIRRLASEWRFWLPDQTAIVMSGGHVYADDGTGRSPACWYDDTISIRSLFLPAERLRVAIGRPVAELLELEHLSPDIIVLDASSGFEEGRPFVTVKVDMPRRLFCSTSGRVWDDEAPDRGRKLPLPETTSSTVVAFPR